ncbi:MAG: shikimate dehydrogenase [Pseudomonadota bacterium]
MMINVDNGSVRKACLLGWPVAHSRSPLIHNTWLKGFGINGVYDKRAVAPENFAQFLKHDLRSLGYVGANVTVPHKEAAFHLADKKDDMAHAVQAANTLWFEGDVLCASNTDVYGFISYLQVCAPLWAKTQRPVVVLGAGGAARAIVYGLLQEHVCELRLLNRTRTKAEELEGFFEGPIRVFDWQERDDALKDCGLLVNTTSLGMTGKPELLINLDGLAEHSVVFDIVYAPLETGLLKQAKVKGHIGVDGLGMLLHQAVPGFHKWFDVKPEVTEELYDCVVKDLMRVEI